MPVVVTFYNTVRRATCVASRHSLAVGGLPHVTQSVLMPVLQPMDRI